MNELAAPETSKFNVPAPPVTFALSWTIINRSEEESCTPLLLVLSPGTCALKLVAEEERLTILEIIEVIS